MAERTPPSGNFFIRCREVIDKSGQNVLPGEMRIAEQERDDVLLRRAAKGDEEAFTLLYRRHQAAMFRFALRMTGNAWGAEEIVQDVFMILMREPKKYDAKRGTLGAFLYGIARAERASEDRGAGFARRVSRGGGSVRAGRDELRGSREDGRLSHRDDSLAAASRAGSADGQARDAAGSAAARERGAVNEVMHREGSA